jgi:hypothetical protein
MKSSGVRAMIQMARSISTLVTVVSYMLASRGAGARRKGRVGAHHGSGPPAGL